MPEKKMCNKCRIERPIFEFTRDKTRPDGLKDKCRECVRKYDAARYANPANRKKMLPEMRERAKAWRLMMREKQLCHDCGEPCGKHVRCEVCQRLAASRTNEFRRAAKAKCFEAYGGAFCACCGERREEFLTLDHVNNDGSAHRKLHNLRGGGIYVFLQRRGFPPGFQVLCYNCNCARAKHKGVCPHKLVKRKTRTHYTHPVDRLIAGMPRMGKIS